MLQKDALTPDATRQAIDVINRNARFQAQLIEDILDVSRIITGKLEIESLSVQLPQVLDAAIAGITPSARAKRIELKYEAEADIPPVHGDRRRLHQVLNNVLSNAVKFTPDGGSIEVTCTAAGDTVTISVRDSGEGITADFLPHIFDRFRQVEYSSTRVHDGLGLGLAIARHLVEQHRGQIRAHSDGLNQGTTISIDLPVGSIDRPVVRS